MQRCCHWAISSASQAIDLGPMGIGAGNTPAFTFRQIVARDHPVASITAGKRRNFLVVVMIGPVVLKEVDEER
jgi:hypothetical protein